MPRGDGPGLFPSDPVPELEENDETGIGDSRFRGEGGSGLAARAPILGLPARAKNARGGELVSGKGAVIGPGLPVSPCVLMSFGWKIPPRFCACVWPLLNFASLASRSTSSRSDVQSSTMGSMGGRAGLLLDPFAVTDELRLGRIVRVFSSSEWCSGTVRPRGLGLPAAKPLSFSTATDMRQNELQ